MKYIFTYIVVTILIIISLIYIVWGTYNENYLFVDSKNQCWKIIDVNGQHSGNGNTYRFKYRDGNIFRVSVNRTHLVEMHDTNWDVAAKILHVDLKTCQTNYIVAETSEEK